MALGELIYTALTTDAGVSALVGSRVYPLYLPQDPTLPAVTYQQISRVRRSERSTVSRVRVQFDCWAQTYREARQLADTLRPALDGYHAQGAPNIVEADLANEVDTFAPDVEGNRIIVDFFLTITE